MLLLPTALGVSRGQPAAQHCSLQADWLGCLVVYFVCSPCGTPGLNSLKLLQPEGWCVCGRGRQCQICCTACPPPPPLSWLTTLVCRQPSCVSMLGVFVGLTIKLWAGEGELPSSAAVHSSLAASCSRCWVLHPSILPLQCCVLCLPHWTVGWSGGAACQHCAVAVCWSLVGQLLAGEGCCMSALRSPVPSAVVRALQTTSMARRTTRPLWQLRRPTPPPWASSPSATPLRCCRSAVAMPCMSLSE